MNKRSKVNKGRGSAVRGWKSQSPKLRSQRRKMLSTCGTKCFLSPKKLKFPICSKRSCKISCKGLVAAKARSAQHKYMSVNKRANSMINKLGCTNKSRVNKKRSTKRK